MTFNDNKEKETISSERELLDENVNEGYFGPNGYYISNGRDVIPISMTFENKLHQSRDETKRFYTILKNELMSFECESELKDKYEVFRLFNHSVAKLSIYCGILRLTLEFNKKKSIKHLKSKVKKMDNVLISNGYIELYVDTDDKCNRSIDLINVLMRDIEKEKLPTYQYVDYASKYLVIKNGRFLSEDDEIVDTPEMVVVGDNSRLLGCLRFIIVTLVALLILTGLTICNIYQSNNKEKYPVFNILDGEGQVFIDEWTYNADADIFDDPNLGGQKIIYPGRQDCYYFYVSNTNDFTFKCNINFTDVNTDKINMKYRLRIANASFNDSDWKDLKSIGITGLTIDAKTRILLALDWTWLESDRDTEIGERGTASYTINIHFSDFEKTK